MEELRRVSEKKDIAASAEKARIELHDRTGRKKKKKQEKEKQKEKEQETAATQGKSRGKKPWLLQTLEIRNLLQKKKTKKKKKKMKKKTKMKKKKTKKMKKKKKKKKGNKWIYTNDEELCN
jgi:hypothetical protein